MNEPRPTPSQQGHPQQPGIRPPQAQGQPAQRPGGVPPLRPAGAGGTPQQRPAPAAPRQPVPADDEPIALDDDESPIALEDGPGVPVTPAPPRLAAIGAADATSSPPLSSVVGPTAGTKIKFQHGGDKHTYTKFKREAHTSVVGATRVRSFHGRLSDDGLAYTDDKINEWLDNHPEVEIKHVNCLVGPLEGKVTGEQGLIVVIWY